MRYAARVDSNQREIIQALEKAGCSVWIIGLPVDLIVGLHGQTHLMEVKSSAKRYLAPLTTLQDAFIEKWRGSRPHIVSSPQEAFRALGLC